MLGSSESAKYSRETEGVIEAAGRRAYECKSNFVAVVETRPFLRECIRLSIQSSFSIPVAPFSDLAELVACLGEARAELVIFSVIDSGADGLAKALKDVSGLSPQCPVVVLAAANDLDMARSAIRSGAKGFIPITMGFEIVVETLRYILAGGSYVPTDCLIGIDTVGVQPSRASVLPDVLTNREMSVVRAIQQGKSNKAIANDLNLSVSTAKVHVRNVMKKLNAKNRTEVAMRV